MTKYNPQEDNIALIITRNKEGDLKEHCNILDNGCIQYTYETRRSFTIGEVKDITKIDTQEARFIIKKLVDRVFKLQKEIKEFKNV